MISNSSSDITGKRSLNISDHLQEKCGIFAAFGKEFEAARLVHAGLWSLQHRGQESSGISASDGKRIRTHKAEGLVAHVYDEQILESLKGYGSIGHNRYSTSGGSLSKHTQPVVYSDGLLALAHNGNLPSVTKLEEFLKSKKVHTDGYNDSELMHKAILYYLKQGNSLEKAIEKSFPLFTGVFCLVVMTKDKIAAVRDSFGVRPLSMGRINGGYVFASETCALNTVNAKQVKDVKPGQMVVCSSKGARTYQLAKGKQKLDVFEFVYFARPDSIILGKSVNEVRKNLGRQLALENNVNADVVIPVPDSAIPAALGFSEVSKIPFDHGFIKNRYIHRTFIRPAQKLREKDVQIKLNLLTQVIKGKRVIVIDDSIVRGTTSRQLVSLMRSAGAAKVYLFISSPPMKYPDFYGIDTPLQKDLIASRLSIKKIEEFIGADKLSYLSFDGLIKATGISEEFLCTSCFTGRYPVNIGERENDLILPFINGHSVVDKPTTLATISLSI